MKKKLISVFSVMALVLGTYTVAMADNTTNSNATGNSLKSFGNVVYTNGEDSVEIYSDDLYILADQLDSFKSKVADQLAEINTYLSSGSTGTSTVTDSSIKIVHTQPSGSDAVDPLSLDFDILLEGLAASQSIPTDVTEYGYPDGTNLYKNSEGELTTDGTEENVEQINISAATPENLSAGSAAWVNGELILGTGADNKAYYNLGFQSGYEDALVKEPDALDPVTMLKTVSVMYNHKTVTESIQYVDEPASDNRWTSSVSASHTTKYSYGASYESQTNLIPLFKTDADGELCLLYSIDYYIDRACSDNNGSATGGLNVYLYDSSGKLITTTSYSRCTVSTSSKNVKHSFTLFNYIITSDAVYVSFDLRCGAKKSSDGSGTMAWSTGIVNQIDLNYYTAISD